LVTTDLDKVSDVTNKLSSCVGHPIAIDGTLFTNIWQALSDTTTKLQEGISQIQDSTSYLSDMVEETSLNYAVIQDTQLMFQTTITSLQESIRKHESRFAKILPVLMSVNQGLSSASVVDIDQKLAKLSQAIEELQEKQWQSALTPSAQGFDSRSFAQLDANVRDFKVQLQTLPATHCGEWGTNWRSRVPMPQGCQNMGCFKISDQTLWSVCRRGLPS
jgi:hypothetical protein